MCLKYLCYRYKQQTKLKDFCKFQKYFQFGNSNYIILAYHIE